ncbi:MAG: serine/threonine protein kinase, partial [Anaerolineae bacterium]
MAASLALQKYISEVAIKSWRYRLELGLLETPPPKRSASSSQPTAAILFLGLEMRKYPNIPSYSAALHPYFVSETKWPAVKQIAQSADPVQATLELLSTDKSWKPLAQRYASEISLQAVNLSFEGQQLFNLTISGAADSYSYRYTPASISLKHLTLIQHLRIPILLWSNEDFKNLLEIHPQAEMLQAILVEEEDHYTLQAGIQLENIPYTLQQNNLKIFEGSPLWALAGKTLVEIANPEVQEILWLFPLQIPRSEEETFRQHYFGPLNRYLPVVGEMVKWEIVQTSPIPRLYLSKKGEEPLEAELRFGYGEHEFVSKGYKAGGEEWITSP